VPTGQVGKFLYVPNSIFVDGVQQSSISVYSINANTGALSAVPGSPFVTAPVPFAVTADRAGTRLFAANRGATNRRPTISVYSVTAASGALTPVAGSPFPLSLAQPPDVGQPAIGKMVVHSSGAFGYVSLPIEFVAQSGERRGTLYGATINATTGELTEIPGLPLTRGNDMGTPAFNAANTVLYVPYDEFAADQLGSIAMYSVNAPSGVLTPLGTVTTTGAGPDTPVVDSTGKFLLTLNTLSGTIAVFTIDGANGTLAAVAGSPFAVVTSDASGGLAVHRDKAFVYATSFNVPLARSQISGFAINPATGALTPIPGTPLNSGGQEARLPAIDSTGRFLYVANSGSDNIAGFAIDPTTGALSAVPGSPFAAGDAPFSVSIDPSGRYLYVPNTTSANVMSFAINPTTGALTPVTTIASGGGPGRVEIVGLQ
jgi:6-phosphogluconolactonase (cycloisomerase 2 family)